MNNKESLNAFANELRDLLEQYDVTLMCQPDYSVNAIYAEDRFVVYHNNSNEGKILANKMHISANDI